MGALKKNVIEGMLRCTSSNVIHFTSGSLLPRLPTVFVPLCTAAEALS